MDVNPYVDLSIVSKTLESELKEVNETWAKQMVNKLKKEYEFEKLVEPTEGEKTIYDNIFERANALNDKKREFYFKTLNKDDQEIFSKVADYKRDVKTIEQMKDNLKEYETFLEVETKFKRDIDAEISTTSIVAP